MQVCSVIGRVRPETVTANLFGFVGAGGRLLGTCYRQLGLYSLPLKAPRGLDLRLVVALFELIEALLHRQEAPVELDEPFA
jgi:hypothetical protein